MGDIAEIVLDYLHKHRFKNAEAAFKAELLARERQDSPHPSTDNLLDWGNGPGIWSSHASNYAGINDHSLTTLLKGDCHGSFSNQGKEHKTASLKRSKSPPKKHLSVEYESEQYRDQLLESKEFDYVRSSLEDSAVSTSGSAYHTASNKKNGMFQTVSLPMGVNASGKLCDSSQSEGPMNNMQVSRPRRIGNSSLDHLSCESTFEPSGDKVRNWGFELATNYDTDKCLPGLQNQLLMQFDRCGQHSSSVQLDKEESVASLPHDKESHTNGIKEALDDSRFGLICNNIKSRIMHASNAGPDEEARINTGLRTMESSFDVTIKREPANKSSQEQDCEVPAVIKTIFPFSGLRSVGFDEAQLSVQGSLIDDGATKKLGSSKRNIGGSEASSEILEEALVDVTEACLQTDCMEIQPSEDLSGHHESEELPGVSHLKPHSMDYAGPARICYKSVEPAPDFGSTPRDENQGWCAAVAGPLNEDVPSAGFKWPVFRPSVSQGIVEFSSGRYSALGEGYSGRSYLHEYSDSDAYEDDDDPGYHRQPIEDEDWFLAHEIDYPSDDERAGQRSEKSHDIAYKKTRKLDEDDHSIVEEDSYFSGEEYYRSQITEEEACRAQQRKQAGEGQAVFKSQVSNNGMLTPTKADDDNDYQGQGFDLHITKLSSDMVWEGFISQTDELALVSINADADELTRSGVTVDGNNGFVRSDFGLSSDAVDAGNELQVSFPGDSREGDTESFRDHEFTAYSAGHGNFHLDEIFNEKARSHVKVKNASGLDEDEEDDNGMIIQFYDGIWGQTKRMQERDTTSRNIARGALKNELFNVQYPTNGGSMKMLDHGASVFEGFSFPSPASTRDLAVSRAGSGKSLRSNQDSAGQGEENDGYGSCVVGPDDTLASWKQKSNDSSPLICQSEGNFPDLASSNQSTSSVLSIDKLKEAATGTFGTSGAGHLPSESCQAHAHDEVDAGAVQQEIRWMAAEDDQYEIFNLRVIHKKNRTGFEEEKDLAVVINSVIAGRYHVTEYLGSAAFSKAVQAHDLRTGMDVCMKIIKNNKDFFDQSLDEIKLLKFVNKHDPADKYHILRLYDYFYHREHLFIVCELLRANLYEFQKFNRESGGEVYFTMSRLQSITRQCLEALEFLHKLGIIHCDLKPENILVKSYSRCEIKIIDLGSSCFQTDHLCSYVQSRSYRAPEVILGLPYDQKIDIWSLGCILAELCSGNVLFQNDSLATLLARVIGILGPIDPEVLSKGRDTHKFFTKNHILYERNQENDQLEYLLPKKTSLRHRLSTGDQGFIEFVGYLLQNNPAKRPTASEALRHPWLSYPYEPASP